MSEITAVFYTSNCEKPGFAERIIRSLKYTSGEKVPIISVSQEPVALGHNVCVGKVGVNNQNAFRQLQVGADLAKTKYVCAVEADTLYPPEYFAYVPERDDVLYLASPVYVVWPHKARIFCPKSRAEGAIVSGREYLISVIDEMLKGRPMWAGTVEEGTGFPYMFSKAKCERFEMENPVVMFRTPEGMHRKTPSGRAGRTNFVPYWGNCATLVRRFYGRG